MTAFTLSAIKADVTSALNQWLDLMEETWGHRPKIEIDTYWQKKPAKGPTITVRASFHIKGFTHDASRFFVTPFSITRHNSPAAIARKIAAEVADHRNTCRDCGEGIAPIWARANQARIVPRDNNDGTINWTDRLPDGSLCPMRLAVNVAPDAVERKLHPQYSKKVDARLRA